ncbi:hypothetical protein OIU79_012773 [Salix purpurea]|uniref:Uncharacterized protein n=1 Tax=Salix purpurea TaxID=77065 RepID=A0A9Q0T3X6_SALPP|nr:hypothetical protein OIU79_012773 [Salix purpurea]
MSCAVTGTEAITGARTHGAVPKSRWKGPARIQRHSSSLTKDSIYTMHTHTSYWTSHSMLIHLPRSPKRAISEAHETPDQAQEYSAHAASPASLPSTSTAEESGLEATGPRGLLEDVVPYMVRNPSNHNVSSNSSSYPSPPTSPPWSPNLSYSCFDIALDTSTA